MYDLEQDGNKSKISIHIPYSNPLYVGYVRDHCLYIDTKNNRHKVGRYVYLGIDLCILEGKLSFDRIKMEYNNQSLMTTRRYLQRNGETFDLRNDRTMLFLKLDNFGLIRAKAADLDREVTQMDIFDVGIEDAKNKNSKCLDIWLKSEAKRNSKQPKREVKL